MPRVRVRFLDGEVIEMTSESVDSTREAFLGVPEGGGNNTKVWVSLGSVKYITFPDVVLPNVVRDDVYSDRQRLVLHFSDGETIRAFADDTFGLDGHAFNVRLWKASASTVERALVPHHALKAIFFVQVWDSHPPKPAG